MGLSTEMRIAYLRMITEERVAAGMLLVVMIGLFWQKSRPKSAGLLLKICLVMLFALITDSLSYGSSLSVYATWVSVIVNVCAYLLPTISLMLFPMYCKAYLEEKTGETYNRLLIPAFAMGVAVAIDLAALAGGRIFGFREGLVVTIGHMPMVSMVIKLLSMVFCIIVVFRRRRAMGIWPSLAMSFYGALPVIMELLYITGAVEMDHVPAVSAFALVQMFTLLHSEIAYAREENRERLAAEEKTLTRMNNMLSAELNEKENTLIARRRFLANLTHDFSAMTDAILHYSNLMKSSSEDSEKVRALAEKTRVSGEYLNGLINDVIEMESIFSGKSELKEQISGVGDLTKEIFSVFYELMRGKNIDFRLTSDVKTEYIYADRMRVSRIIMNLVYNAYIYTPEGGQVKVDIRELKSQRRGYTLIQTSVSDTGRGIPEEYLADIFNENVNANPLRELAENREAMSLPIVKRLATMMDGTVEVDSEEGVGTKIIVTMPHRIAKKSDLRAEADNGSD